MLICFMLISVSSSGAPKGEQSVTIKRQIEPVYPGWAYTHGVSEGFAKIAFYVDETGEASGFLPIEYSHEAFSQALLETILKWKFVPAHREGVPVKSVCHAYWEFLPDRPIETNAMFDISKRINEGGAGPVRALKLREESELDEKPKMLAFPGLVLTRENDLIDEDRASVRAKVSFFVLEDGSVRLPQVVELSDAGLELEVEACFNSSQFSTPVREGKATLALLERVYDIPIVWQDVEAPKEL